MMNKNISVAIADDPMLAKVDFNRLAGSEFRLSMTDREQPDDARGRRFTSWICLSDTGGIGMLPEMTLAEIQNATESQADFAIRAASFFFFVVDREGLSIWMRLLLRNSEDG